MGMAKKIYFGTNLKMYKTIAETCDYLLKLVEHTRDIDRDKMELFVIPSFTALYHASKCADTKYVTLGAQNMCWEEVGQYTGEISPIMIKELGIDMVMVGHSERRHVFRETDEEENRKIKMALKYGFKTLLCIGETLEEKQYGVSREVLRKQLKIGFHGVDKDKIENLMVAYEPVWSIGVDGIPASADYAAEMHKEIKSCLREIFGTTAENIPVLYGGSVNPNNAVQLIQQKCIDGLFIGRSAWDAERFDEIIREAIK